jgi:hypothetical protein
LARSLLILIPMDTCSPASAIDGTIKPRYTPKEQTSRVRATRDTRTRIVMKRSAMLPISAIALSILLMGTIACTTVTPAGMADPYTGASWSSIRAGLATPEAIEQYLRSCSITYKGEKPNTLNHTQPPEETIGIKTGDCEDYASLITDALIYHGYEAKIISVEAKTSGGLLIHAVAIYRDPSTHQWHYIHGYRFKALSVGVSKGFDSEIDVARYIAEKMNGKLYQYFVMSPEAFVRIYDAMKN